MFKPREYQEEIHRGIIEAIKAGYKSILVQAPTGGGKTAMATRTMAGAVKKGNTSVFYVPRRELAYQTAAAITRWGVEAGIVMAGEDYNQRLLAQVASFDTVHARAVKRNRMSIPPGKVVHIDEAHLSAAKSRAAIVQHYLDEGAIVIGWSATPARGDGKPLGDLYQTLITSWPVEKMIAEGYLVQPRYWGPSEPDLKGVRTAKGDFMVADLEGVMVKPKIIGEIVDNWVKIAHGKRTVVFCVSQSHGRHQLAEFKARGIPAEYVDANTPKDERAAIFERVRAGETLVLVNIFVASYGLDIPELECCILARPTKSIVLYHQMVGRVLRPVYLGEEPDTREGRLQSIASGTKPYAMVIDHGGIVQRLGRVEWPVPWTLSGEENVADETVRQAKDRKEAKDMRCPRCQFLFRGTRHCPQCGFEFVPQGAPIPTLKADLVELDETGKKANRKDTWEMKAEFMAQAKGYVRKYNKNPGMASHLYRDKYGVWPNDPRVKNVKPSAPSELIMGFIKHRAIKSKMRGSK